MKYEAGRCPVCDRGCDGEQQNGAQRGIWVTQWRLHSQSGGSWKEDENTVDQPQNEKGAVAREKKSDVGLVYL